jgi:alcohol dehydrogenase YqhD (iron-dependent ADH family)
MHSFALHMSTKLLFGPEKGTDFYHSMASEGAHALVVIGGGSVERIGLLAKVLKGLDDAGIKHTVFKGIEPNPVDNTIDRAAAEGVKAGVDCVLAVGGGSVMDASKAIAALIHEKEPHVWPFVTGQPRRGTMKGALPVFTIPTTAATASELTPHAVISKPEEQGKCAISYPFLQPTASWLNPEFHTSLPAHVTADGGADILSHVFENYILGDDASPFADRYSEGVMDTVIDVLPRLLKNLSNVDLRGQLQWVSAMALNSIQVAGRKPTPFPLHAIEHSMSGYHPALAHGRGLATLFPAYFRMLLDREEHIERLAQFGRRVFWVTPHEDRAAALAGIEALEEWMRSVDLYQSMEDIGIPTEAFDSIAQYAVDVYGNGETLPVSGQWTKDEVIELFNRANEQSKA